MFDFYVFICLLGFYASLAIRFLFYADAKKKVVEKNHATLLDRSLVGLVGFSYSVLPHAYALTNWFSFADYERSSYQGELGLLVLVTGLYLFYLSHAHLGTNWSPILELKKDHKLITDGLYKYVRHPMYTAVIVHTLSQLFFIPNLIVGPSAVISFAILFFERVDAEEQMMERQFGSEYKEYKKRVSRLIPSVY